MNLFVGLVSYLKVRIRQYNEFCMICHSRFCTNCMKTYSIKYCNSEKPVVCCNPLCIFRYSEIIPEDKKRKISEEDRITICPFTNYAKVDARYRSRSLQFFGDTVVENSANEEMMLQMHNNRYLPSRDVLDFIHSGVKNSGMRIKMIENVMQPDLVRKFEERWARMIEQRGISIAVPQIAYHGTAEKNISSILSKGFLVPGEGDGKQVQHATDQGWWGKGVYLSPNSSLSIGYCRGGNKLLICSVLMGVSRRVNTRMDGQAIEKEWDSHTACNGEEWVIGDPTQILPCYLISFSI
eukprot:TRINITY_DN2497_c0_g1_i6.p1 TRINITY_DN2497_c0_g1~~TRINITY_DN2497_c0_g1_i6.p1  ORF type:complete len:295 (-),score=29.32 TRINITY_DN2497_c0_g1_i6:34-918(-)